MPNTKPPSSNPPLGKPTPADRTRYLRLAIWREWERMWKELTAPGYTGTIRMEISTKDGRPGEPRFTEERYGVPGGE